jgi:diadenosine tetraphosphate (Ap4A) HIT family hydrolase
MLDQAPPNQPNIATTTTPCELCESEGGLVLHRGAKLRVVAVGGDEGRLYRGFCRVIWHAHVREMTDLSADERAHFMHAVFQVESALRLLLNPDKINLASLGNMTPHLHWHVIPRFRTDAAFPKPIWSHTSGAVIATLPTDDGRWQDAIRAAFTDQ